MLFAVLSLWQQCLLPCEVTILGVRIPRLISLVIYRGVEKISLFLPPTLRFNRPRFLFALFTVRFTWLDQDKS